MSVVDKCGGSLEEGIPCDGSGMVLKAYRVGGNCVNTAGLPLTECKANKHS
jgi:hypothetical protein